MKVLKNFYKTTKPWGFWKAVYEELKKEDPTCKINKNFWKDIFNCIVGVVWQMTFVLIPIYLLIKEYDQLFIVLILMIVISIILKYTWYNKIGGQVPILR